MFTETETTTETYEVRPMTRAEEIEDMTYDIVIAGCQSGAPLEGIGVQDFLMLFGVAGKYFDARDEFRKRHAGETETEQ